MNDNVIIEKLIEKINNKELEESIITEAKNWIETLKSKTESDSNKNEVRSFALKVIGFVEKNDNFGNQFKSNIMIRVQTIINEIHMYLDTKDLNQDLRFCLEFLLEDFDEAMKSGNYDKLNQLCCKYENRYKPAAILSPDIPSNNKRQSR